MKTLFVSTAVPGWVERLGWSLVYSLWQLAAIALVAALLHRCLRHQSARVRYFVAVAMLALMVVGPVATWCLISIDPVSLASSSVNDEKGVTSIDGAGVVPSLVTNEADSVSTENSSHIQAAALSSETPKLAARQGMVGNQSKKATGKRNAARDNPASVSSNGRRVAERISQILKPRLPILVGIWFVGVLICSIRPIWSLWIQWQLRRTGLALVPESIQSSLNSLAQKMRLTRVVRVAQSTHGKVPMVVGYLRPMILLPASVLTGLTPSQLEAVLAHELAHVRRHDWLINAIQVLAETLLFYHPAVWWLSRRIRHERELCCDDIALGVDIDRAVYARTLLTLEELRQKSFTPALAATGGDLASRVRRLLPITVAPHTLRSSVPAMLVIVMSALLFLSIGSASLVARLTQLDEPREDLLPKDAQTIRTDFGRLKSSADSASSTKPVGPNEQAVTGQVLDVDGKPAAQVLIAYGTNWGTAFRKLRTDIDGRYKFEVSDDMKAQPYRVFVVPDSAAAVSRAITKKFGEQPTFRLQPGTRLTGKVLDVFGKGVPNVVVEAEGGNVIPTRYAITDASGEYTTAPCQYGSYDITVLSEGKIPNTETKGARLSAAYSRFKDAISKTARTSQRVPDFRPVESVRLEVHLLHSGGVPIADERLFLSGSYRDQRWLQQFREIEGRPGLYDLMVPKGLSGRFMKLNESRMIDSRYLFGGPGAAIRDFERDESVVLFRQAVSWIDLQVAVNGKPISMQNELRAHSSDPSTAPFSDALKNGDIRYSIVPTGDPVEERFQNTDILGPISRNDSQLSVRVAPDTEYSIHLSDTSGNSWKGTVYVKENEMKSVKANLLSETPVAALPEQQTALEEKEPVVVSSIHVAVNEDTAPQGTPGSSERTRTIEVLDENEQLIVGAEVRLQFQYRDDNSYFIGELMSEKTNEKGIVEVAIPEDAGIVSVTVRADGFGEFSERQQATGSSSIRLKRGRVIHVRAVDEAGIVLKKAVPLLAGHRVIGREFVPQEDGAFKSPAVDLKRRLMRVVTAQDKGPMLFSELVDVAEAEPGTDGVLELVLKPGTRLTGRLDDSVPRPISEGYAELMIVEGPNRKLRVPVRDDNGQIKGDDWINPWTWEDSASVQADGTFTFESVPSGGIAQLHVVVDGHMSVNPSLDTLLESIEPPAANPEETAKALKDQVDHIDMWPHLVALDKPIIDATIKCQPTASCDFRILDPAGNPVPEARVSFSPNIIFISGKLFIPGSYRLTSSTLVDAIFRDAPMFSNLSPGHQINNPEDKARQQMNEWGARSFSGAKSDANGRVKIRNLPDGTRKSFRVWANGFVLPKSQLYPPDSFGGDDRREAYVDLISGETIESTIYLDREQPVIDREVLVMDDQGRPLPGVRISLSEMRVGPKDWQLWSTQRFGAVQSAKSDQNGRVVLSVPSQIGNVPVERLRLAVNYEYEGDNGPFFNARDREEPFWINGGLVDAPLKADDGFVAVIRNPDSRHNSKAVYGTLENILPKQTSAQLMAVMIKHPSLAILRQLLASAKTKQPEPIELLDEVRGGEDQKGARVHLIPSGDALFALVSARVRPVDGTRANEADMSNLPECVFVFDSGGQHMATLGGEIGTTGAGSAENTSVLCLGPEEDWFVRITRFQENGPFEYQSTYYRIGNPVVNSLRYFHYPNSNAWSNGPEKIARYGSLYFDFPGSRGNRADDTVGTTKDGVSVNGIITWDADQNQFVGVAEQSVDGRPLYKVDTEWSKDFEALTPKANQIILSGGAREHDHWYGWSTFVPEGFEAVVSVSIPQADGDTKIIEQKYSSGRHTIQFQAKPNDDGQVGILQLGYDKDTIHNATIPLPLGDPPAVHPPIVNVLNPGESMQLVRRSLKGSTDSLALHVKLQSVEK